MCLEHTYQHEPVLLFNKNRKRIDLGKIRIDGAGHLYHRSFLRKNSSYNDTKTQYFSVFF